MRRTLRGFTIVELLVVITIIGLLMALLIPAASGAIASARRAQCINQVQQLCKATMSYTTKKQVFPPLLAQKQYPMQPAQTFGWPVWLLPDMSRQDLYDIAMSGPPLAAGVAGSPYVNVASYVCPSDPAVNGEYSPLSYAANAGIQDGTDNKANGVFMINPAATGEKVTIDYITRNDGMPQTVCFAENVNCKEWYYNQEPQIGVIWAQSVPGTWPNKDLGADPDYNHARPSSRHGGGFVVGFCDTHAVFMNENIDYGVYCLIMTPAGKKATYQQNTPLTDAALNPQ